MCNVEKKLLKMNPFTSQGKVASLVQGSAGKVCVLSCFFKLDFFSLSDSFNYGI